MALNDFRLGVMNNPIVSSLYATFPRTDVFIPTGDERIVANGDERITADGDQRVANPDT